MPNPFNNQAANEITRAWDTVVLNRATPSKANALAETIRRVHALDDAPAPDRAYVAALRQSLLAAPTTVGQPPRRLEPAAPIDDGPVERLLHPSAPIPIHERRSRHWQFAAVAAVLVLLIAGVELLRPKPDSEPAQLGAIGSPSREPAATNTPKTTPAATATIEIASTSVVPDGMSLIPVLHDSVWDGDLITLYEATRLIGEHLDVSANDLSAEYIAVPIGPPTNRVSHAIPGVRWRDEIVVNADTGRIVLASYPSRSTPSGRARSLKRLGDRPSPISTN